MDEVGKTVWVQNLKEDEEEVYKLCTITAVSGNNLTLQGEDGQVSHSHCHSLDTPLTHLSITRSLIHFSHLNPASLVSISLT